MKKIVIIPNSFSFDARIDVPESADFKVGDSIHYAGIDTKIVEIRHNLNGMTTYFICG
jgi:hypothetical protein